jgi:2-iminoacetate synthase
MSSQGMSFYETIASLKNADIDNLLSRFTTSDVERAISKDALSASDFFALLSGAAENHLEAMARKAHLLTLQNFGRTIQLYTPLYLSDYCVNQCLYCGFNRENKFKRKKLGLTEVKEEAQAIAASGLKHILVLTGESRKASPVSYIKSCVETLKDFFSSISIEIYPLSREEYSTLVSSGVDGLTIYQETYNEDAYKSLHPAGPKRDFLYRLDAPARGALAGMRQVNIGALLGLSPWRKEACITGLHAKYLMDAFPDVEIGVSIPRLRPHAGGFQGACRVSDKDLVQILLAMRLFMPRLGVSLSTREDAGLRENLLPLGITRMSAGSVTSVGGHGGYAADAGELPQFEIADHRNVCDMMEMLNLKGYAPVLKDWTPLS